MFCLASSLSFPPAKGCKRRSRRKSQQYFSDQKQSPFGTLKWHKHREGYAEVSRVGMWPAVSDLP